MMRSVFSLRSLSVLATVFVTLICADMASAQEADVASAQEADVASAREVSAGYSLIDLTPAFGVALTVIGAAFGISRLASSAYESMSRQPEVAASVQTAMIIAAALIEGFTFFALFICWTQS